MNKTLFANLFLLFTTFHLYSQTNINPENIEIARDEYGVPHIFSETDAEAVYGVAWAQCEDNFNIMQENLAIAKGLGGMVAGKEGAGMDFIAQMFEIEKFVEERYKQDISPEVEKLLEAYVQSVNTYAEQHPEEVLVKKMFPLTVKDVLEGYTFNFIILSFAILDPAKVVGNKMDLFENLGNLKAIGSNAMAYSPNITSDDKTYLVGNPHLPVEGPINFWELSVHSKEGLEMWGATFTGGGLTPMIGTNRHLGWSHTVNAEDFGDVYELTMHPKKKKHYQYDGEWLELEEKVAKLKVKIGPLVIPIRKKYYISKYGSALKNKSGYYAFRNNSFFNIRQIEQWYEMGKASNYDEFWEALKIQGIPSLTITYADDQNNILHFNNGMMPIRDESYEWRDVVPGNTAKTCWGYDKMYPVEDLIHIQNPKCGYVFNMNNTPMDCTAPDENPQLEDYPKSWGIYTSNTARAKRFKELIAQYDEVSFEDIKAIRDDQGYHSTDLNFRQVMNMNDIYKIAEKYPELVEVNEVLKKWDRRMNIDNKQASLIALVSLYVEKYVFDLYAYHENTLSEKVIYKGMKFAKRFLKKHYGTLEVELGKVQKMVRGDKELPMYGSPQTLANCHTSKHKNGKIKLKHGDTFIMYNCYGKDGLEFMKTVNLFGNSTKPDHPHYTSQMELYVNQKVKEVELDLEKIRQNAERIYHPK